jgi:hypothetical protein
MEALEYDNIFSLVSFHVLKFQAFWSVKSENANKRGDWLIERNLVGMALFGIVQLLKMRKKAWSQEGWVQSLSHIVQLYLLVSETTLPRLL